ncbi:hypothetical protein ACWFRF_20625 [Nocardia sp. NPDC055165]
MSDFIPSFSVHGPLKTEYFAHIDRIIVSVGESWAGMSWHLPTEQATILRDQLDAAIAVATGKQAGGHKICDPCSGRGLIRFDRGGLTRCEDCAGEGAVPR